jgi:hypothetical protein
MMGEEEIEIVFSISFRTSDSSLILPCYYLKKLIIDSLVSVLFLLESNTFLGLSLLLQMSSLKMLSSFLDD